MNGGSVVGRVIIGTDPHKRSATVEVRDEREILLATGRFGMDTTGYRQLLGYVRQWPARMWAVEGANGTGRPLAARLLADGEAVVDVPAKLAARGAGLRCRPRPARPTPPTPTGIAMAALRTRGLRQLTHNEDLAVLRLLADRREGAVPHPRADPEPAAPAAERTGARRRAAAPVRPTGKGVTRRPASAGRRRADPRVVEYEISDRDGNGTGELICLITSITDPAEVTAVELATAYHDRWENETSYQEKKTYLRRSGRVLPVQVPEHGAAGDLGVAADSLRDPETHLPGRG